MAEVIEKMTKSVYTIRLRAKWRQEHESCVSQNQGFNLYFRSVGESQNWLLPCPAYDGVDCGQRYKYEYYKQTSWKYTYNFVPEFLFRWDIPVICLKSIKIFVIFSF